MLNRITILAINKTQFDVFDGLSVSICEPLKDKTNPVLPPSASNAPDSFRAQYDGSIIKDNGTYHMWYVAFDAELNSAVAYATSNDGINWQKPNLGLVEYRGNKENNLVFGLPVNTDCISVIKDDDGLFKAAIMDLYGLTRNHVSKKFHKYWDSENRSPCFMGIAISKDGIKWDFEKREFPVICEKLETCRLMKINGKYIMNGQQAFPWAGKEWKGRVVSFYSSDNLKNWTKHDVLYQHELCETHVGIAPIAKIDQTLVGLCGRFQDAPELPDQHFDIGLVISQDGISWREPAPCQSFIRRGDVGSWDAGGVVQGQGLVQKNGKMHVYYTGTSIGNSLFSKMNIGRVTFSENRFGYAALEVKWDLGFTGVRKGRIITKPVKLEKNEKYELSLNAGNLQSGSLKAAVMDSSGNVIKGYDLCDCNEIKGDNTNIKVSWKDKEEITGMDKPFKLLIEFEGGVYRAESPFLYAINIEKL